VISRCRSPSPPDFLAPGSSLNPDLTETYHAHLHECDIGR
jgi:hypothetical protein